MISFEPRTQTRELKLRTRKLRIQISNWNLPKPSDSAEFLVARISAVKDLFSYKSASQKSQVIYMPLGSLFEQR